MQVLLVATLWEVAREGGERSGHGAETDAVKGYASQPEYASAEKPSPEKVVVTSRLLLQRASL